VGGGHGVTLCDSESMGETPARTGVAVRDISGRCKSVPGRCGKNLRVFHAPTYPSRSVPPYRRSAHSAYGEQRELRGRSFVQILHLVVRVGQKGSQRYTSQIW
jgi:hypothetical protein